ILKTVDGGKTWEPQTSGTREWLRSITFDADGQQGWAAGVGGTILKTVDGGKTWEPQASGTGERLNSITFDADGQQGWAAGEGGTILKTEDGGKSWQAIAYRFYPAPWFYVVALIALLIYAAAFWWRARLNHQSEQTQSSTAMNRGITDNPVGPGEQDLLGARLIADSLTRFLTNENTRPPLTLAITGEWGSGKSSVMNYLSANLKRKGLKPVWFNAWHHREEPSVLASILANVHKQAIKPWWLPSGLWFRLRLLWRRHWLWKALLLMLFASLAFMGTWLSKTEKWNETWRYALFTLKIEQPVMLGEKGFRQLCPEWASLHDDSESIAQEKFGLAKNKSVAIPQHKPSMTMIYANPPSTDKDLFSAKECKVLYELHNHERIHRNELNCLTSIPQSETKQACYASPNVLLKTVERRFDTTLSLDDEKTLQSAMEYLSPDLPVLLPNAFVSWLTALSALLLFLAFKGMALLGLAPVSFIQGFLRTTGAAGEATEKVGTRLLFESHFKAITRLLGQRRLVLFIDDLDRCDPEHTRKVLEVSNFLSSSGELFMVIGMSPKQVLINLTLGFKETAQIHDNDPANAQPDPAGKTSNTLQHNGFARNYLQKLIHIEVPVPKPETAQIRALLMGNLSNQSKAEARMVRDEKREARADKVLAFSAVFIRRSLFFLAIAAGIYLGIDSADQTRKEQKQSSAAVPQAPVMISENKAATAEPSTKRTDVADRSKGTTPSEGELFRSAYTQENFQKWPLQFGVALALFAVLACMVFFVLLQRLNRLDDKEWLSWIKPLLQRLKIALLGPEPVKDTESFTEALEIWHPLIALKDPTPRTIKAFLNRLRYLVSRRNSSLDSGQQNNGQEAQLVALAAISYVYWKDFDGIMADLTNPGTSFFGLDMDEKWTDLMKTLREHQKQFGKFPSQEDIKFYKRMTQDIQIHRPD
ncbi:MAG: P-loop NTPase fold protein, partial [Nitrosomonas sp.]|nr:P-loop NTPase fold protein [Nitrosomonas sp.]